jgi:hypothetical protein
MDPEKPRQNGGADRPTPLPPQRDSYVVTTRDDTLGVARRRQSTPTSPGIVATTSLVPPPPVSTPPVPELPTYLIHPPTLPKQHVYAPMAPLGALSIGLMKHKQSEEDQFSRLINGKKKTKNFLIKMSEMGSEAKDPLCFHLFSSFSRRATAAPRRKIASLCMSRNEDHRPNPGDFELQRPLSKTHVHMYN